MLKNKNQVCNYGLADGKLTEMKPLENFDAEIQYLFTDIDDTLTAGGRLQREAFVSLWELFDKGVSVIPVTGRPAGWCELIARQWPVRGVIGENGAFYFAYRDKKMRRHFLQDSAMRERNRVKLQEVQGEILEKVPGAALASDQFSRLTDLAIDFCEDVPPLSLSQVRQVVEIFTQRGATARVSSIHVNGWFGTYNKLSACQAFCTHELGIDFERALHQMAYIGDSPNDEPMFQAFIHSFGVSNVKDFVQEMTFLPKYITSSPRGQGFSELTSLIVSCRGDEPAD